MRNRTHIGTPAALTAAILALVGALLFAGAARAQTVYTWKYDGAYPAGSFSAADAVPASGASPASFLGLMVDQANNTLNAGGGSTFFGERRLYKFNLAGQSAPWSSIAPNTWVPETPPYKTYAVDNSGTATQGRIYAMFADGPSPIVHAYLPSGEEINNDEFPLTLLEPEGCGVAVDPQGDLWVSYFRPKDAEIGQPNGFFEERSSDGTPTGKIIWAEASSGLCGFEFDSQGDIYSTGNWASFESQQGGLFKFFADGTKHRGALDPGGNGAIAVDRSTNEMFAISTGNRVRNYDSEGGLVGVFGQAEGGFPGLSFNATGIAVDEDTHTVYVSQEGPGRVDKFVRTGPTIVPDARTTAAEPTPTTAVLRGTVNPDGVDTTSCYFEWGTTAAMSNAVKPCLEGNVFTGASGTNQVHAEITGLSKGQRYHFRLVAKNANEGTSTLGLSRGITRFFRASSLPTATNVSVRNIDTGGANMVADLLPNGSETHFQFEWGTESGNYTHTVPADPHPPLNLMHEFNATTPKHVIFSLTGLQAETTYYFRFKAVNDAGTTLSPEQAFKTFAKDPAGDTCDNAHVRQQTGARLLYDCRAYELVSARNTGGYDVESDLGPNQFPLVTSPDAQDRLLYSLQYGSVPGIAGNPTNFGHDPYVAVRGGSGWSTEYVGLPADGMADPTPYGSPLLAADSALTQFAFGGEGICDPCFADGSTNIPLRRPGGTIEKGIPGTAVAEPNGELVTEQFSGDGSHFVFATDAVVATGGDPAGSIYDRNLTTGVTQVVSKLPNGTTMPGGELGSLDISSDGSRIVVATSEGTDTNGNAYWHPYLHVGSSSNTIDLAPGTTSGVLYAGMSADGSRVFYSTKDKLLPSDTDESADVYEAAVSGGSATLNLVSVDGATPSNGNACTPPGEWNAVGNVAKCSALPFAGGAGVSDDGAIYFLSPEKLAGGANGELNQPNVYLHRSGEPTQFVATLKTSDTAVAHALSQSETHSYGDFQISPTGRYAAFSTTRSLTGYPNGGGRILLYRFDSQKGVDCVSCPTTGITPTADTPLLPYGLALTDDGRVFFTTSEQLVLRDTNGNRDAYEWLENEAEPSRQPQLISTGSSPLDSSMLGTSHDGVDAFFFTREVLTPDDENGNAVKVYDARETGGFPFLPSAVPCAASDECHGPGSATPPPPDINTFTGGGPLRGSGRKATTCRKGFVKRKGRCVRKHRQGKRHQRGGRNG